MAEYLGVPLIRPSVGFFDFTSCEGCQLQVLNNEEGLLSFLALVKVVNFREAMTGSSDEYDIAFIEGSITRRNDIDRLKRIRANAGTLVALGSCACFGGVNQMKNRFSDPAEAAGMVYGSHPVDTMAALPVGEVVHVDLMIYGCPVNKKELERIVLGIALGRKVEVPDYPVCMECKAGGSICLFDLGQPCLGPVTRAGCGAWCTSRRAGCWGCRGPCHEPNMEQMHAVMERHGFPPGTVSEMLGCFGGFRNAMSKGDPA